MEKDTRGAIPFITFMLFLWKWVHRKEPIMSRGEYSREGMKIEISEGSCDKELEDKLDDR